RGRRTGWPPGRNAGRRGAGRAPRAAASRPAAGPRPRRGRTPGGRGSALAWGRWSEGAGGGVKARPAASPRSLVTQGGGRDGRDSASLPRTGLPAAGPGTGLPAAGPGTGLPAAGQGSVSERWRSLGMTGEGSLGVRPERTAAREHPKNAPHRAGSGGALAAAERGLDVLESVPAAT